MKKEYLKALGFGAIIWMIMFALVSAFIAWKITSGAVMTISIAVVIAVAAYLFTKFFLKPDNYIKGFICGTLFVVVGLVLDFFISKQFAPDIFKDPAYWLSYLLLIVVAMFAVNKSVVASGNIQ